MTNKQKLELMLDTYNIDTVPDEFEDHIIYEVQKDGSLGIKWVSSVAKATELLVRFDWPISIKLHVDNAITIVFGKLKQYNGDEGRITESYHAVNHPAITTFTISTSNNTIRKTENWYHDGSILDKNQVKKQLISFFLMFLFIV
jgi:hypothetical protein